MSVCKTMFLRTLGLKTDGVVTEFLKKKRSGSLTQLKTDNRGKATPQTKLDDDLIVEHINSYHPQVSHYDLNNAPNRRYLDPHLTITDMWKHYNDIHPERKISYIAHQRIFTKEKISFGKPSQDDCDLCAKYKSHCEENSSSDHDSLSCEMCQLGKVHEADASEARDNYRRDREEVLDDTQYLLLTCRR
ncbi:hypothetical protein RRG08_024171 [Elysia crispata]|uniref:Uncharacterized protein n=1 Tax=Elysia crispata TaxID=231223 RepID=A0AAE0YRT3_9GAST|nr:hypothetical protein RRG08_024171 [Elysia crispata]